jgi:hypothetical protein
MPRKHETTLYSFDELSPKAKERAIKDFRNDPELTWDDTDSHMLTETFQEDLKHHYGLGDMKVGWSLSSCQGDGVCFHGSVNIQSFIKAEEAEKQFQRILKLADEGLIGATITHESRYCHWNSMHIEVELYLREGDLLPRDLQKRIDEWEEKRDEIIDEWNRVRSAVIEKNMAPVREWEQRSERYKRGPQGPREWTPRGPGPKPESLNYPVPPEPVIVQPDWLEEAKTRMQLEYLLVENETKEFETYLDERVKEISKEMEKNGYDEIESHQKDEYITEILENRDWEYLKDGERWDG